MSLEAVTIVEHPEWGALMGTVVAGADGVSMTTTGNLPPLYFFVVLSGPCTTALVDGHFCVGRWPGGYGPNEDCAIAVAGGGGEGAAGGVLDACPVFDTSSESATLTTLPSQTPPSLLLHQPSTGGLQPPAPRARAVPAST
eukprot:SAG31_NODE_6578_length_1965_cov_1.351018_2_plen_141_part_00